MTKAELRKQINLYFYKLEYFSNNTKAGIRDGIKKFFESFENKQA